MLRRCYNWMIRMAAGKHAVSALAAISFIESSVFPIPPDIMLIPMCLADRKRALYFGFVCTVASVLGGVLGYAIGYYVFETVGQWILNFYNATEMFNHFQAKFNEWGFWWVLAGGCTPIPYKIITITSGVTHLNIWLFAIASVVGRGGRFFIESALLWKFGEPIRNFIEKRLAILSWVFVACLIGGFVAVKYAAG